MLRFLKKRLGTVTRRLRALWFDRFYRGESAMLTHPEHFYTQSAAIPYQWHDNRLMILVISSRSRRHWVVPKGVVELHLTPQESAAKEALEEAGIHGPLFPEAIGSFQYAKWGGTCTVEVFVMRVEKVQSMWMESHRLREWVTPEEAMARMRDPALAEFIGQLPEFLEKHGGI